MATVLINAPAPWCPTGYGQQTLQLGLRLRAAGHRVLVAAHYGLEGAAITWNGLVVLPGANDPGNRLLPRYIDRYAPDLVLTLQDVWTLKAKPLRGKPLASWVPIDHEPLGEPVARFLAESDAIPIAMSRHGERQLAAAGFRPLYVPHAIDTAVFSPQDRADARETCGIPESAFAIVMVAGNMDCSPSRKGWEEALRAFKAFHDRHDDAVLYMHTSLTGDYGGGDGLHIPWLCESLGIDPAWLRGTPRDLYEDGLPAEQMAKIFSAGDVLLAPSYGEGFGIPVVEAQACGTPVIVSDFSAQPELCGAGWLVEGERVWIRHYRAEWQRPNVESIVDALEHAYTGAAGMGDQAVEFASLYDADKVFNEQWLPVLGRLVQMPNRAARRRAEREKAKVAA